MENETTPGPWYARKSGGDHQGLIASEKTGATVALTYDVKDAALVAAAPSLLAAAKGARNVLAALITGDLKKIDRDSGALRALRDAISDAENGGK